MTCSDTTPTVAVTAPVRLSERAIPEVVLEAGYQQGLGIAAGVAFAKDLANLPGNVCTPTYLAEQALELGAMIEVSHALLHSALQRTESRGAHQRLDHEKRDDANFLKHSMAYHNPNGDPRIEYLDAACARAFNAYDRADFPEMPHLMVEFHGSEAGAAEDAARFGEIAAEFGALGFRWSAATEERNALWRMRHNAYHAIMALRPGCRSVVTDVCVPISRLAEAIEETVADIEAAPIPGPILGHVGDGNFHCALLVEPGDAAEMRVARELSARMAERALRLGGTVTGEHGVGLGKMGYMRAEHGDGWSVMAELKRALDPQGILNPGKATGG